MDEKGSGMPIDKQREILPQWAGVLASPQRWGRLRALEDCQCDLCLKRRLLAEFADTLLALRDAREVIQEMVRNTGRWCPMCGFLLSQHMTGCKLAKVLGEGR